MDLILGQQVLLYNSILKPFLGRLKSRWSGPFRLTNIHPHGDMDLKDERIAHEFMVNGQRVKHYVKGDLHHSREDLCLILT